MPAIDSIYQSHKVRAHIKVISKREMKIIGEINRRSQLENLILGETILDKRCSRRQRKVHFCDLKKMCKK